MAIPTWRDISSIRSNIPAAITAAQRGFSSASDAARDIMNRNTQEELQQNKLEQQAFSNRLSLDQAERAQKALDIEQEDLVNKRNKDARDAFTRNKLAEIMAAPVSERKALYSDATKDKRFAPSEVASLKFGEAPKGTTRLPTAKVQEYNALVSTGVNPGDARSLVWGKNSKNNDLEFNIAKTIGSSGNASTVYGLWDRAKKLGMSNKDFNKVLALGGGYDPEKGVFDFGKKDIDIDALREAIESLEESAASTEPKDSPRGKSTSRLDLPSPDVLTGVSRLSAL